MQNTTRRPAGDNEVPANGNDNRGNNPQSGGSRNG